MSDYTIHAMRVWSGAVFESLQNGEGCFGWSYIETANLHELKARIDTDGWDTLNEQERDCYQRFLLDLKENDYVVYINVPEYSKCTLARVTGPYFWCYEERDFNHRFHIDPASVKIFDRNDAIVHPALSRRLKLQGRYWRIYTHKEFDSLVKALKEGKAGKTRTPETNLALLTQDIQPDLENITKKIQHTNPNFDLEDLIEEIFKKVPGVQEVQRHRGLGDHGADLTVVFESGIPIPGLQQQQTCLVQVKSYQGEQWNTRAVEDIRNAFNHYPDADMGLIVSTASVGSEALENALEDLREETGKPVSLLIGADVAAFLLRFGADLLG